MAQIFMMSSDYEMNNVQRYLLQKSLTLRQKKQFG